METNAITSERLSSSVIAVPPLARTPDLSLDDGENRRLLQYLESAGVRTMLFGGNAVLSQIGLSEFGSLLQWLAESAGPRTLVMPSVGPGYGMMMDQATMLKDHAFPAVMVLPTLDPTTVSGVALGIRRLVDRMARPAVLYLKRDGVVDADTVRRMWQDGLLSWIKYAIVREHPRNDPFLQSLIDAIGAGGIVSGMGEQPAVAHWRDFGLAGFTSGCVCVAPRLSMAMLRALRERDFEQAERIRSIFAPLEGLRDRLSPVRVLHAAVQLAGICRTGAIPPFLSAIDECHIADISVAARSLWEVDQR